MFVFKNNRNNKLFISWILVVYFSLVGWLVIWSLTPFSATFQLYRGCLFYWKRKPENPEKTTNLSEITDKLIHIMVYTLPWSRFELTTPVVIGADCISVYCLSLVLFIPYLYTGLCLLWYRLVPNMVIYGSLDSHRLFGSLVYPIIWYYFKYK